MYNVQNILKILVIPFDFIRSKCMSDNINIRNSCRVALHLDLQFFLTVRNKPWKPLRKLSCAVPLYKEGG